MKIFILSFFTLLFIVSCKSDNVGDASQMEAEADTTSIQIKNDTPPEKAKKKKPKKSKNKKANSELGPYYQKVMKRIGITESQAWALKDINKKYKSQRDQLKSGGKWDGTARKNWRTQKEGEIEKLLGAQKYAEFKKKK